MEQRVKTSLGFGIIFIVIATGGVFAWQYQKMKVVETDVPPANINMPRACTEEANICPDGVTAVGRTGPNCEFSPCPSEDLSDWQTYRNEKHGYELKYPTNFLLDETLNNLDCISFIDNNFDKDHNISVNKIVEISIGGSSECNNPTPHYSGEGSSIKYLNGRNIKIGDYVFVKKQYQDIPMSDSKEFKFYTWTILNPKINLTFMYNNNVTVDPEGHEAEFENILSTFKFTK